MPKPEKSTDALPARLGLWDAVSIIVGIVVGVAIFRAPQLVFANVSSAWMGLGAWLLGGVLSFIGALCYAELATTYPRIGGDYVYLSRAYGRWVGFLFGWGQLAVILTGSIGTMAYAFADYAVPTFGLDQVATAPGDEVLSEEEKNQKAALETAQRDRWTAWLAAGAVAALTLLNLCGVMFGKAAQNVLTAAKVIGLVGIIVAGFGWGSGEWRPAERIVEINFGFAMVMVLYAFGGWNDCAFVAAEVRHRERNIPLALLLGISGITIIYLLANGAYLMGLGFDGLRGSSAPAADVLTAAVGEWGGKAISVLVMVSALGAINGLIFTGARVYAALGADHRVFALLGRWNLRLDVPVWSLLAQGVITLLLIVAVGTEAGRGAVDASLGAIGLAGLPWDQYFGGFETLVAGSAPVFWAFFLLTGLSLFQLRWIDRERIRPFSAPFYPFTPFIFCLTCTYMLYSSLVYAKALALIGIVPLLLGLPLYWLSPKRP
ncbi:MAG: amino acid permease [Planctomycetes bacterium]|nr:amino acid permease [Planctomycetota bacterium]